MIILTRLLKILSIWLLCCFKFSERKDEGYRKSLVNFAIFFHTKMYCVSLFPAPNVTKNPGTFFNHRRKTKTKFISEFKLFVLN